MVYRKDRYVWGAVLFRTTRPEVVGGAIVRRSERLYWTSQAAAMEEVVAERRRQRQHVNRAVRRPSQLRCCAENDVSPRGQATSNEIAHQASSATTRK